MTVALLALSFLAAGLAQGWYFATIFCVLIFVHETGHWVVARASRLALTGPLVIYPLGGLTTTNPDTLPHRQRAHSTLIVAGPLTGAGFATICALLGAITGNSWALVLARVGVSLNLWQLLPVGVLDGGRLSRLAGVPRWLSLLACAPIIMHAWWLCALMIPVPLTDQVVRPPSEPTELAAVRRIALGGWILTGCWLITLRMLLAPVYP